MSPHALAPDDPHLPRGVGIYVRRISRSAYGTPTEAARRAADHGLSFVAMPSVWQDDRGHLDLNTSALEEEYAAAFRALGLHVWVWGYPDLGREVRFVADTVGHARRMPQAVERVAVIDVSPIHGRQLWASP